MDDDRTRPFVALAAGAEISHYRIVRRIGSGGMGEVYLAHDKDLNRNVALKFLAPALCQDSECRQRFTHEAQAAAKLNHPNIVTVYEVSEFQGRPFFAMEMVEGQSLKDHLADGQISLEEFAGLIAQICEGLSAAHEAGVVHRDIKPSNILIDAQGRAKIVDFGLAMVRGVDSMTRPGSTAGTPAYMSPEQVRGEGVGAVSDLFSLGVVMYQMLTGSLPFAGEYEAALIYSIANDDPTPVSRLRPDIPPGLESVVGKLLEKDSKNRYQSARDVIQELQPAGGGANEEGRNGKSKRYPRIGFLAALILILIVVVQLSFDPFGTRSPERKMLAVLPFENLGPPEDEYFADGMTDAITLHLARFSGLGVISRASSILYKKSDKKPQEIGAELGATYLLTGTIQWEKNDTISEVQINTALVKASDGSHVWANSYSRVLDRIFVMQSDIAQSVGRALSIAVREVERDELAQVPTDNLQAYDYFLRGNEYFNRSWEQDDIQIATQMYQQAVDLDPEFALAWAMLARGHASMYWEYYDRSEERRQLAVEAANKSLELQPDLVEGHLAMGYCHYHCLRDYQRALEEFELALQKQPNNAELYTAIAAVQRRQGDFAGAVENFMISLELDPRSHLTAFDVGITYGMMRQYELSEKYLVQTISLAPDWPLPYIYRGWLSIIHRGDTARARQVLKEASGKVDLTRSKFYWWLSRVVETDYQKIVDEINPGADTAAFHVQCAQLYRLQGKNDLMRIYADSARVALENRLREQPEDAGFNSNLGLAYAYLGMKEEAMARGKKAIDLLPMSKEAFDAPFFILNLAEVLVVFEQYDAAIEQIRFLLSIPGFTSSAYLKLDPLWAPLRDQPEFQKLLTEAA